MSRPRRHEDPCERLICWVSPFTAALIRSQAQEEGVSVGVIVERAVKSDFVPQLIKRAEAPTMVKHLPRSTGWGTQCEACQAIKSNNTAWAMSCPGPNGGT